jgi:hypothetical protein
MLRDCLACGTNSAVVKEKLLQEDDVELVRAIEIARGIEISRVQMRDIYPGDKSVHFVQKLRFPKKRSDFSKPGAAASGYTRNRGDGANAKFEQCRKCGRSHPTDKCPAKGRSCLKCNKLNLFAAMCKPDEYRTSSRHTPTQEIC